jgi:hypothetical protein
MITGARHRSSTELGTTSRRSQNQQVAGGQRHRPPKLAVRALQFRLQFSSVCRRPDRTDQGRRLSLNQSGRLRSELLMRLGSRRFHGRAIRSGRRGVRPGLRRVHPQAPGHPARCLTRGNEGGFPLTLADSRNRRVVHHRHWVSTSPAREILVQARSKDCGQHGAAGPDPHLA